ncbi:MAG: hypothetical protein ABSC94_10485 [Polyangiaceae bacterium]|jgi:ATP-dependent Zn protease
MKPRRAAVAPATRAAVARGAFDEEELTAVHEAGHAVVAWRQRIKVRRVTIVPSGDALGEVLHDRGPALFTASAQGGLSPRAVENRVLVLLAGSESEKKFRGRYDHAAARCDYDRAVELLTNHAGSQEEVDAWMKLQRIRTSRIVSDMWGEIRAVAAALLRQKTVTGTQVAAIIERLVAGHVRAILGGDRRPARVTARQGSNIRRSS